MEHDTLNSMRTGARVHASILIVAMSAFSCQERGQDTVQPVPTPVLPAEATTPTFRVLDGPKPGTDTPYNGTMIDWLRWTDALGTHIVIVSEVTGLSLLEGYPNRTTLQARHYLESSDGNKLVGRWVDSVDTPVKGIKALLYRDSIWAYDLDADGFGEVFLAYHIDDAPETGPKRLGLVVFSHDETYGIRGSTRYDPTGRLRIAATTVPGPAFSEAPPYIRDEALKLWSEVQFHLAEPPSFPGFADLMQFDGANFSGFDPVWSLILLPSHMELTMGSNVISAAISYTSLSRQGRSVIIEGSGIVEAWNHTFRVTIIDEPYTSPGGQKFQYGAIMEWSDGTRLAGWGNTATDGLPAGESGVLDESPQVPFAETQ